MPQDALALPQAAPRRSKGRVMIVDDEQAMGRILVKSLEADGFEAVAFSDPLKALAAIVAERPEIVLTDVRMPGMSGRDLLERLRSEYPEIPVLVMTAYGTIEDAVDALKSGAYSYITKPFQHAQLVHQMELALAHSRLKLENDELTRGVGAGEPREMIGRSQALERVRETIARAAKADSVVLISGESGSGKELIAREIHMRGPRRRRPFVAVNCPAIPPSLIESELFGHERGAFTGADRTKMGLIELSGGGTLFLDEIGEIPREIQAKLLRVIQEREVQRLGGLRQIPIDLRVVAATNRDLEAEVAAGRFRADLYYRLKVISIEAPPLRRRSEDIPELAERFLERIARRTGRRPQRFSARAVAMLEAYAWPGNVRELENAVERAAAMSSGGVLEENSLPSEILRAIKQAETVDESDAPAGAAPAPGLWPADYKAARERFERMYLRQIVQSAGGNMARASRLSGISRRHLYEKLERLGLDKDSLV